MQNEPKKTSGNYNELRSESAHLTLPGGIIELQSDGQQAASWQEIVLSGLQLVNGKIGEILGENNRLTSSQLAYPKIRTLKTDPDHPDWAGYFSWDGNKITVVEDKIDTHPLGRMKVFIHEYIHFLCHNGRDDSEQVDSASPLAQNNNIGFRRYMGLDIREGAEGKLTSDYFLAFNEAVTEQLAIDILPGIHETYSDYRGLLNQTIDDAVTMKLGSTNESGIFVPWSRDQLKNYIYGCFFKGDLAGFTHLLKTTYAKYDISEQQFGLMTHRDDLPSVIEQKLVHDNPDGPPPALSRVAILVQRRLDNKLPADYVSDVIVPEPGDGGRGDGSRHGIAYDSFVEENHISYSLTETINGVDYDTDNTGLIIFHGDDASVKLHYIKSVFDSLLIRLKNDEVDKSYVNEKVDKLLFETYQMSMLSAGFRDFYIYKHSRIDGL